MDDGMLEAAEIDTEDMEIAVEEDVAVASSVYLDAAFGGATLEFEMTEEAPGDWKITSMDVSTY